MSTLSISNKQNFKVENIILATLYSKIDLNGVGELVFIRFNAKLCKFEILNTVQMNPIILAKQYGDCSIIIGQISNIEIYEVTSNFDLKLTHKPKSTCYISAISDFDVSNGIIFAIDCVYGLVMFEIGENDLKDTPVKTELEFITQVCINDDFLVCTNVNMGLKCFYFEKESKRLIMTEGNVISESITKILPYKASENDIHKDDKISVGCNNQVKFLFCSASGSFGRLCFEEDYCY